MSDDESVKATIAGYEMLCTQARLIAMLPLEDWMAAINKAETLGPILDPTLYRAYLFDPECKGEIIKSLIEAALPLKHLVLSIQDKAAEQYKGHS